MENQQLRQYITESLAHGHTKEQIEQALRQAGWQTDIINQAFSQEQAETLSPIPIPTNDPMPQPISKPAKRHAPQWLIIILLLLGGVVLFVGTLHFTSLGSLLTTIQTIETTDQKLTNEITKDYSSIAGADTDPTKAAAEKLVLSNKLAIDNTQGNGKLNCEETVGYENGKIPHEGMVCERSYAIEYGFNGRLDRVALQKIVANFHANGWTYYPPLPNQTEADAIKGIAAQYASDKKLDYTDVSYTKGLLYSHFRLATNNIGQPAEQNFCDVLCNTIHANMNKYLYFVEIYVQFKEYKYVDGWKDPNGGY